MATERAAPRFWVNVVSRDHVVRGIEGGFTQTGHGKAARLEALAEGDSIVFYSPRTELDGGEPLQAFTAIGEIIDQAPHVVEGSSDGQQQWRRNVRFESCVEAPIRPLLADLDFIASKQSWGVIFRRGLFQIAERDFCVIRQAMQVAPTPAVRESRLAPPQ